MLMRSFLILITLLHLFSKALDYCLSADNENIIHSMSRLDTRNEHAPMQ